LTPASGRPKSLGFAIFSDAQCAPLRGLTLFYHHTQILNFYIEILIDKIIIKIKEIRRLTMKSSTQDVSKRILAEKISIFGKNMRIARKNMDLTAAMLGKFLGLSAAYVGLIERGKRAPSLETFLKICDFFGISYNDMLADNFASTSLSPKSKQKAAESKLIRKQEIVNGMINTFSIDELNYLIGTIKNFKGFCERN
jgi:transcriptional regulator with XRE-family HTH domain